MRSAVFLFAAGIFLFACKKESDIGGDILPGDDLLNAQFTDTATVLTKTVEDEAVRTDKMTVNYLGTLNDPRLGRSKAALAVEFYTPTGLPADSLAPFTLDSVNLYLKYGSYYGDTSVPQTFTAGILSSMINENNAYFSDASGLTAASEAGRADNYRFSPSQKIYIAPDDTIGVNATMRIPLNATFGNSILSLIGDSTLTDSALFKTFFPGLLIQNEGNAGNCMVQPSVGDVTSKIVLFYKDRNNKVYQMTLPVSELAIINNTLGVKFNSVNLYDKDYTGTDVPAAIASTEQTDSVTFVLGQAGLLTKVSLPNLMNFGRVAVNKAILEVTRYIPNGSSFLSPPGALYLSRKNSSGDFTSLLNYGVISFSSIDSSAFTPTGGRYIRYNFNITGYVQDVLFGRETNSDIYINTHLHADKTSTANPLGSFGYAPAGVILGGGNLSDPQMRAKLKLTYSPVK